MGNSRKTLSFGILSNVLKWNLVDDLLTDTSDYWPKAVYDESKFGFFYKLSPEEPKRFYSPVTNYGHALQTLELVIPSYGEFNLRFDREWVAQFKCVNEEVQFSRERNILLAVCEAILLAAYEVPEKKSQKKEPVCIVFD